MSKLAKKTCTFDNEQSKISQFFRKADKNEGKLFQEIPKGGDTLLHQTQSSSNKCSTKKADVEVIPDTPQKGHTLYNRSNRSFLADLNCSLSYIDLEKKRKRTTDPHKWKAKRSKIGLVEVKLIKNTEDTRDTIVSIPKPEIELTALTSTVTKTVFECDPTIAKSSLSSVTSNSAKEQLISASLSKLASVLIKPSNDFATSRGALILSKCKKVNEIKERCLAEEDLDIEDFTQEIMEKPRWGLSTGTKTAKTSKLILRPRSNGQLTENGCSLHKSVEDSQLSDVLHEMRSHSRTTVQKANTKHKSKALDLLLEVSDQSPDTDEVGDILEELKESLSNKQTVSEAKVESVSDQTTGPLYAESEVIPKKHVDVTHGMKGRDSEFKEAKLDCVKSSAQGHCRAPGKPTVSAEMSGQGNSIAVFNVEKVADKCSVSSLNVQLESHLLDKFQDSDADIHTVEHIEKRDDSKVLHLIGKNVNSKRVAVLKGHIWPDAHVHVGDTVYISGQFDNNGYIEVNDKQHLLVVDPHRVISCTTVVGGVFCRRKAILNEKFRGCDPGNEVMLIGTVAHEMFQGAVKKKIKNEQEIRRIAEENLREPGNMMTMYSLGINEGILLEKIASYTNIVSQFVQRYMTTSSRDLNITDVVDIEECVVSHRLGLKGRIDLTVEVEDERRIKRIVPLELKTGKGKLSAEHIGQVTLYCAMMESKPTEGLLVYLQETVDKMLQRVQLSPSNLAGLIQIRNEQAHYLRSTSTIQEDGQMGAYPSPKGDIRSCDTCPHLMTCSLYQRLQPDSTVSSTRKALVNQALQHLSDDHLTYFKVWSDLINLESATARANMEKNSNERDLSAYSTGVNLGNLARLMSNNQASERLRELVINNRQPCFRERIAMANQEKQLLQLHTKGLNKNQKTFVAKALMFQDYLRVQGYPGTGKTTCIAAVVACLVTLGQSVLITSYTHSALDNILLKLKQRHIAFVRLGRVDRIHPDIQFAAAETQSFRSVQDVEQYFNSKMVVGCTCLGSATHPIFMRRTFNVCIVDEASQVLQPTCIGPLLLSQKFILVGDSKQLPPVVQNASARSQGMDKSLFDVLQCGAATFELKIQYRMNSVIMRLSNRLIYEDALQCGNKSVETATIRVGKLDQQIPFWLQKCVSDQLEDAVVFLNTDKLYEGKEIKDGVISNEIEVEIVQTIVNSLDKLGLAPGDVGVITPYRLQVDKLHSALGNEVEVNTVDQFQGRDKSVIVLSLVKAPHVNHTNKSGGILDDLRRLNVALTRAKHKLIAVGSKTALVGYCTMSKLFDVLESNEMVDIA